MVRIPVSTFFYDSIFKVTCICECLLNNSRKSPNSHEISVEYNGLKTFIRGYPVVGGILQGEVLGP